MKAFITCSYITVYMYSACDVGTHKTIGHITQANFMVQAMLPIFNYGRISFESFQIPKETCNSA